MMKLSVLTLLCLLITFFITCHAETEYKTVVLQPGEGDQAMEALEPTKPKKMWKGGSGAKQWYKNSKSSSLSPCMPFS